MLVLKRTNVRICRFADSWEVEGMSGFSIDQAVSAVFAAFPSVDKHALSVYCEDLSKELLAVSQKTDKSVNELLVEYAVLNRSNPN